MENEVSQENQVENTFVENEIDLQIASSLNEISYKMDSLVFRQEEQTGAFSQAFGIFFVFLVCVIIYKFIKGFIDFD